MNTINDTKIILKAVYILFGLAILSLGLAIAPTETNAQATGSNLYFPGSQYPQPTYYQPPAQIYYVQPPVYVPTPIPAPAPTPTLYSSSTNPNAPKTIAKAKPTEPAKADETEKYSDLAASAIFGENSFLPTGLIQWILLAILVLGGVILVRKVYGGSEKYYATPMKHN